MENTGITKLVLAVSGGLDSTVALLVCVEAMALLDLPRKNIIGVTLPGFGTSDTTYYNALNLLEKLEVTRRDISIKAAVQQHFEDIGHGGEKDITYENAQARERTQVILDIANMIGGLMVGTGDLSEEALGFCTFGGDQLAGYNVNCCITKTVLRELTAHIADNNLIEGVADILRDILDTPVSPELLPPDEAGDIQQKTEEILGPYILHDFFLYHFIRYRFGPTKLYFYACMAFAGEMEPPFIKDKLRLFLKRFCAGQFKRACAPDAAAITQVNLLGANYRIPSDLDPSFLLAELEEGEETP
jgi:NAD+ synthase (glutamine-hydrolysing)